MLFRSLLELVMLEHRAHRGRKVRPERKALKVRREMLEYRGPRAM